MSKTSLKQTKIIAIVGPTASGKTKYSIELAKQIGGEIISADSRLVYKWLDIGTAKPTEEEKQGIPHYMIDIVNPEEIYSAGLYKKEAEKIINDITLRGKIPIVVGGTGLYIDILLQGYNLPPFEPNYDLRNSLSKLTNEELYDILTGLDEKGAQNISINDRKKIIRSIEIIKTTNLTLEKARSKSFSEGYDIKWIGCNYPRPELYERINKRVDIMIENGLVEETKRLIKNHGRIDNIINTIGYKEILEYIDGKLTLEQAAELLKKNTRNYAKRQLTWFRRNTQIEWNTYPDKLKK